MFTPIVNGNIASLVLLAAMGAVTGACVHSLYIRILSEMGRSLEDTQNLRFISRQIIRKIKESLND